MSEPAPSPPADATPEPEPSELTEFFCSQCGSSVWVNEAAELPAGQRRTCPECNGNLLEQGLNPFRVPDSPSPLSSGYDSFEDDFHVLDELEELNESGVMNPADARLHITRFVQDRLHADASPEVIATATANAMSLLDRNLLAREPPALTASIAVLHFVKVSDPEAVCAVCLEDLPLASAALKLPCSHLYHSFCVVPWLEMHNSCPLCRSPLSVADPVEALPPEQDLHTTITIQLATTTNRRVRVNDDAMFDEAPISESPSQLAQAVAGEAGNGPANSGETVSSEWPPQPESDTVMSEALDGDGDGFFD